MASKREQSFLKRHFLKAETLETASRKLSELQQQDHVYIQDQSGLSPKAWSKSGTIVECLPHNSYLVRIDGSGHLTRRNRQFLRKFIPYTNTLVEAPSPTATQSCEIGSMSDILDTPLAALVGTLEMEQETNYVKSVDHFVSI